MLQAHNVLPVPRDEGLQLLLVARQAPGAPPAPLPTRQRLYVSLEALYLLLQPRHRTANRRIGLMFNIMYTFFLFIRFVAFCAEPLYLLLQLSPHTANRRVFNVCYHV